MSECVELSACERTAGSGVPPRVRVRVALCLCVTILHPGRTHLPCAIFEEESRRAAWSGQLEAASTNKRWQAANQLANCIAGWISVTSTIARREAHLSAQTCAYTCLQAQHSMAQRRTNQMETGKMPNRTPSSSCWVTGRARPTISPHHQPPRQDSRLGCELHTVPTDHMRARTRGSVERPSETPAHWHLASAHLRGSRRGRGACVEEARMGPHMAVALATQQAKPRGARSTLRPMRLISCKDLLKDQSHAQAGSTLGALTVGWQCSTPLPPLPRRYPHACTGWRC